MGTLTIRNLADAAKAKLRQGSVVRGVSLEAEVRARLKPGASNGKRRRSILAELEKLAVTPEKPFNQKRVSDAMWDES